MRSGTVAVFTALFSSLDKAVIEIPKIGKARGWGIIALTVIAVMMMSSN